MTDWHEVQFFESAENVRKAVKMIKGRTPSLESGNGVAVCMQQGRAFMQTAESAPIDIRPLLIYYGVVAFSKAIVLVDSCCSISSCVRGHGLKDISKDNAMMSEIVCKVERRGTFFEFVNATLRIGGLRCYDADLSPRFLPVPFGSADSLADANVKLDDVFSRLPDLRELYGRTYGKASLALIVDVSVGFQDVRIRTDLDELFIDRESLVQLVTRLRVDYPFFWKWRLVDAQRAWGKSILTFVNIEPGLDEFDESSLMAVDRGFSVPLPYVGFSSEWLETLQPLSGGACGGLVSAIQPLKGSYLSDYALMFIGSFLLGSLVRYRPQTWRHSLSRTASQSRQADDRELALIEKFSSRVIDAFPDLAVSMLRPNWL